MCVCVRECEFKFFFGSLDLSGADGDGVGETGGQKSSQNSFFFLLRRTRLPSRGVGMLPKTHTHTFENKRARGVEEGESRTN